MSEEPEMKVSEEQATEALLRELAEIEARLQGIQHQRAEQELAQLAALEQEREEYRLEYAEKMRRQELIIQHGMRDPFWFVDGGWMGDD